MHMLSYEFIYIESPIIIQPTSYFGEISNFILIPVFDKLAFVVKWA